VKDTGCRRFPYRETAQMKTKGFKIKIMDISVILDHRKVLGLKGTVVNWKFLSWWVT